MVIRIDHDLVCGVHLKTFRYVDQKLIDEKIVSC